MTRGIRPVLLALAAACVVAAASATARAGEPEFPLGPWARAGRPVVVRVPGASRVRGGGAPWALPAGDRGDEFVLQMPRADLTLHELEIDEAGIVRRAPLTLRALRADGTVVATFGPPGPDEIIVPRAALPTLREAWLLFDDVRLQPGGLAPAEARALAAWRASPRPGQPDAAFEPLAWPAGPDAFRAAALVASRAPRLPRDIALVLLLAAVAELSLLLLVARRRPAVRAAWLAGPPLAALAWMLVAGRLPGDVRAVAFRLETGSRRLWIVRFDAPRGGEVSFRVPDDATAPAILRYDAEDNSAGDASVGRDVVLPVPAGQSRVVAWSVPVEPAGRRVETETTVADAAAGRLTSWLDVVVVGEAPSVPDEPFVRRSGFRPVEGAAFSVAPGRSGRK